MKTGAKQAASKTVIAKRVKIAWFAFSGVSSEIPSGTLFDLLKMVASAINNKPTAPYKTITLLKLKEAIMSSFTAAADPNSAKAIIIGPNVVPNEFMAPPRLILLLPVLGSPLLEREPQGDNK